MGIIIKNYYINNNENKNVNITLDHFFNDQLSDTISFYR